VVHVRHKILDHVHVRQRVDLQRLAARISFAEIFLDI
jgi:hypothetical protein